MNMSTKSLTKTFDEVLLDNLQKWRDENPGKRWDKDSVAEWMIEKGLWRQPRSSARRELAKLITKAAKKKRVRNAQGKCVRAWHAASFEFPGNDGPVQRTLWEHRDTLTADFAQVSFQQRWEQAAGFCRSLHDDVEDFNLNNKNSEGAKIQMEFDFTTVVELPATQQVAEIAPSTSEAAMKEKVMAERKDRADRQPR